MSKIQVLVATMNKEDGEHSILEKMNITSDAVIINQCNQKKVQTLEHKGYSVTWVDSPEKGLSKSRNQALLNADSDICVIADDDLVYIDNYMEIIRTAFQNNPDIDIIAFQIKGIEKEFKKYPVREKTIRYIGSMKVSSVQIAFRLRKIKESGIDFDELFGAGARFPMGEENIFLFDALKSGLKIKYIPQTIAYLHIGNSTWFQGYNKKYFVAKGAAYTRLSRIFSLILIMQFAIRKRKIFMHEMPFLRAVMYMLKGKKEYIKGLKELKK